MSWRTKLERSWGRLGMKYNLADICEYVKGKVEITILNKDTYISTENMIPNKGGITSASSLPTITQTQAFFAGDILVSNIRPYFKKIWFAEFDGGCSNDVLVFRAKDGVNKRFLYYVLADDAFFDYSMVTSKGTKMPRGDKVSIMKYEVPVFSYEEQGKIAGILEVLDRKIKLNTEINKNLFQQAQSIYKSWFIDFDPFDGKMPLNWSIGKVGDIIELYDSKRIPLSSRERAERQGIYPYYGATSIMDYVDDYLFDGIYLLLGEDGTVSDSKGYPILQYVDGKFWVNNHAHIIRGKHNFSVEMLYVLFSLTNVQSIITGAVQPKISQQNLKNVEIVIPSENALLEIDSILQPLFSEIRNRKAEIRTLTELRDSLLTKLMSGELDISDIEI